MKKLSIKIYGITTVGPKGQIIIPKESREDLDIQIGSEYSIVMVENKTFGIGNKNPKDIDLLKNFKSVEYHGNIKIGTKFQFVIPNNIRKLLNINIGDNLLVVGKCNGLGFIKNDNIDILFEYIKKLINK